MQMLEAREVRARRQQELLEEYGLPLISFTMNIAGPVKTSPLIERAFDAGLCALRQSLPPVTYQEATKRSTGCTAFFAVDLPAEKGKEITLSIEEATPVGRLFDMDVLDTDGQKLTRKTLRSCIVCGKPGRNCAARRLHTVEELQAATTQILTDHFAKADAKTIANIAVQSLIDEVHTTPKPGLVDERNCGSHEDMDLPLFERSAETLRPYFEECVTIGQATARATPAEAFSTLKKAGLRAEQAMLQATGGVNTHKGAIYTMGLLCGALGRLWNPEAPTVPTAEILQTVATLAAPSTADLTATDGSTAGLRLYQTLGLTGIRGEAAAGLPSVAEIALPTYEAYLKTGYSQNEAGALTLLHLIAEAQDTNLYHRGGSDGAAWAKEQARALLTALPRSPKIANNCAPDTASATHRPKITNDCAPAPGRNELSQNSKPLFPHPALETLDDAFISRNLSPGGCADLLAATYFLHKLQ